MVLSQEYKRLLDSAFETHFANWSQYSPSDPLKMMSESLAMSLSEIERRQHRVFDLLLSSLPSLFGFSPRPGQLPSGYFQFHPSPKLAAPQTLSPVRAIRFQAGPDLFDARLKAPATLNPLESLEALSKGHDWVLTFRSRGPLFQLPVFFHPQSTGRLLTARLRVQGAGEPVREFRPPEMKLIDDTHQGSQAGILTLSRGEGATQPFCTGPSQLELVLSFFGEAPKASFFLNTFLAEISSKKENLPLGFLKGDAWEEIPLPAEALLAPSELELHFPDDHTETVARLDTDALKIKALNPNRFLHSFFYQAENHSLIFPAADQLIHNYGGAVQIAAPLLVFQPPKDWTHARFSAQLADTLRHVEKIHLIAPIAEGTSPETTERYLTRFYASLRQLRSRVGSASQMRIPDLVHDLLKEEPALQQVEITLDAGTDTLKVFLLNQAPLKQSGRGALFQLSPATLQRIQTRVEGWVPLTHQVSLAPFSEVPCLVRLHATLRLSERRLGTLPTETIENRLRDVSLSLLLPPPFGLLEASAFWSKQSFLDILKQKLEQSSADGTHFLAGELEALQLWICNEQTGSFLDAFTRKPGELLAPQIEVHLDLLQTEKPNPSESPHWLSFPESVPHAG